MTDIMQFESPEEVRDYLRSEFSRTDGSAIERMQNIHGLLHSLKTESTGIDFEEVVGPLVTEWCNDNPEVARGLVDVVTQLSAVVNEAARPVGLIFNQITTAAEEWVRNNPEAVQNLFCTWEILAADGRAAGLRDQYDKDGVTIPFEKSVRLAFCLMAFRIPYAGDRCPDEGDVTQVYDFEMRAVYALREGRLRELIEGAQASPLDSGHFEQRCPPYWTTTNQFQASSMSGVYKWLPIT